MRRNKNKNRRGAAAVEAAVCLPILIVVWFGSFELSKLLSLKQQAQLLASQAANDVLETSKSFESIEQSVEAVAVSLDIQGCDVRVKRVDDEIVESKVTFSFAGNSPLSSVVGGREITSSFYSYRED